MSQHTPGISQQVDLAIQESNSNESLISHAALLNPAAGFIAAAMWSFCPVAGDIFFGKHLAGKGISQFLPLTPGQVVLQTVLQRDQGGQDFTCVPNGICAVEARGRCHPVQYDFDRLIVGSNISFYISYQDESGLLRAAVPFQRSVRNDTHPFKDTALRNPPLDNQDMNTIRSVFRQASY